MVVIMIYHILYLNNILRWLSNFLEAVWAWEDEGNIQVEYTSKVHIFYSIIDCIQFTIPWLIMILWNMKIFYLDFYLDNSLL